jgi:hypothetical protein
LRSYSLTVDSFVRNWLARFLTMSEEEEDSTCWGMRDDSGLVIVMGVVSLMEWTRYLT